MRSIFKAVKVCSYCGRKNEEEAFNCFECGTQVANRASRKHETNPMVASDHDGEAVEKLTPGYSWGARDAWKCLGMFVGFDFVLDVALTAAAAVSPPFQSWWRTGAGHLGISLLYYTVAILTMLYFARVQTVEGFLKAFGLDTPPSSYIWFAVVATLAIRAFGHVMIVSGWSPGATTKAMWGFTHAAGLERYLYLAPAFIAPFGEELFMRGFVYRAFRGSYSVPVSTMLILAIVTVTHWGQVHRSWSAAVDIGTLNVLQCFLRERTGNLRDCVICHLVYNASGAFTSVLGR